MVNNMHLLVSRLNYIGPYDMMALVWHCWLDYRKNMQIVKTKLSQTNSTDHGRPGLLCVEITDNKPVK